MMVKTTIQVDAKTLAKLKKIRISRRESYDEVVNRLIEASREHKWRVPRKCKHFLGAENPEGFSCVSVKL